MIELTLANVDFKAQHGDTLKPPKDLVMNVWKTGPDIPKITPKADKYSIPQPNTHVISLPTIYLHIAIYILMIDSLMAPRNARQQPHLCLKKPPYSYIDCLYDHFKMLVILVSLGF